MGVNKGIDAEGVVVLGGCVRAIFALLKTSCLLPYYFERIFKKLQKTSKNFKYAFNARNTYFVDTKLSVRIKALESIINCDSKLQHT